MRTVKFRAGETIISEGEDGNTAFLIVSGSVDVSVGTEAKAQTIGTLNAGEVFGELCLIEPGPRSATVKAVTNVECVAIAYDDFIPLMQNEPQRAILLHEEPRPEASRDEQSALHRTSRSAGPPHPAEPAGDPRGPGRARRALRS